MSGTKKGRNFSLVSYIPESRLRDMLYNLSDQDKLEWFAYCVHDADKVDYNDPNSPVKQLHTHIFLRSRNPVTCKNVRNTWFYDPDSQQNTLAQICSLPVGACRYLMHLDDPAKTQYPRERVHTNKSDFDYFISSRDDELDISEQCLNDVLSGLMVHELVSKYGNYWVQNSAKILRLAQDHNSEMLDRYYKSMKRLNNLFAEFLESQPCDFNLENFFITEDLNK